MEPRDEQPLLARAELDVDTVEKREKKMREKEFFFFVSGFLFRLKVRRKKKKGDTLSLGASSFVLSPSLFLFYSSIQKSRPTHTELKRYARPCLPWKAC